MVPTCKEREQKLRLPPAQRQEDMAGRHRHHNPNEVALRHSLHFPRNLPIRETSCLQERHCGLKLRPFCCNTCRFFRRTLHGWATLGEHQSATSVPDVHVHGYITINICTCSYPHTDVYTDCQNWPKVVSEGFSQHKSLAAVIELLSRGAIPMKVTEPLKTASLSKKICACSLKAYPSRNQQ